MRYIVLLKEIRLVVISRNLRILRKAFDNVLSSARPESGRDVAQPTCVECQYTVLGCMTNGMIDDTVRSDPSEARSPSLLPIPEPEDYRWSAVDLKAHIDRIKIELQRYGRSACPHTNSHSKRPVVPCLQSSLRHFRVYGTDVKPRYIRRTQKSRE